MDRIASSSFTVVLSSFTLDAIDPFSTPNVNTPNFPSPLFKKHDYGSKDNLPCGAFSHHKESRPLKKEECHHH